MVSSLYQSLSPEILLALENLDLKISSSSVHEEVNKLLERTVLVGGKRVRPMLTFLMSSLFDVPIATALPFARMIELLHAASLSHDDVVDNATTRRGNPSINIVASNKRAVLAGDMLFAEVIVSAAKQGHLGLVSEIAHVIQNLSDGEWLQLELARTREISKKSIEQVAMKKTASVMSWCCIVGPYLAKKEGDLIEMARDFGRHLGLSFQYVDDTLDFKMTGQKDILIDLSNGIVNTVMFEWFQNRPDQYQDFMQGKGVKPSLNDSALNDAIERVLLMANHHLNEARKILEQLANDGRICGSQEKKQQSLKPLHQILDYLGKRNF